MPIAKINGISINFEVSGKGPALLLITGFGSNLSSWAFQVRAFGRHFRVIRFDNRGIGKSDKPQGPYSIQAMAEDAIGLLDHLGIEKAHIVGHSMGGAIAQEVAINHPERVSRLVLCATFARRDELHRVDSDSRDSGGSAVEVLRDIVPLAFNRRILKRLIVFFSKVIPLHVSDTGIEGQRDATYAHDAMTRLRLIQAPTLVMVGTGDRLIRPSSSEIIAKRIPNARLLTVEGGSHVLNIERRREFNSAVLSFLTESAKPDSTPADS